MTHELDKFNSRVDPYLLPVIYSAIHLKRSLRPLRLSLKDDYGAFWNNLSDKIGEADANDDKALMFWAAKVVVPRPARPLPMLLDKDDRPATSPIESRRIMQSHFKDMLGADIVSLDELSVDNVNRQADLFHRVLSLPRDVSLAPN